MPQIGDRKRGRDIGQRGGALRCLFEWSPCRVCGKLRWVTIHKGKIKSDICKHCSDVEKAKKLGGVGEESPCWKGGYYFRHGYKYVWIPKTDSLFEMARNSYIAEHRLEMARFLGRLLEKKEIIHHKNGVRDDNRIENLELTIRGKHAKEHNQGYIDGFKRGYLDGKNKANKEAT